MAPLPYISAPTERSTRAGRARWAILGALLLFWGLALWNLDRYPPIHFDEATILEPGYQLFYNGVYGAPMYTGFYGQERVYLEVPPLMSLLQGASTWLLGVGVWQMRYFPVVCGLLTLALTAALAARLAGPTAGLAAAWLLLLWKWTPSDLDFLGSGLPLLDVARIARYDILVPVFGLSAFLAWLRGRTGTWPWLLFASGLLAGLSGLANVYGAFWIAALGLLTLYDNSAGRLRRLAWLLAGAALPVLGWAGMLAAHWDDTRGQFIKHAGRFDLLRPSFYLDNMLNEPHRYFLGVRDPATYLRLGFWLAVLGLPASLAWLAWRWRRAHDARAAWLLAPALVLPALLALLDSEKRFYYLIVVIPVFAISVAWAATAAFQAASRNGRGLLAGARRRCWRCRPGWVWPANNAWRRRPLRPPPSTPSCAPWCPRAPASSWARRSCGWACRPPIFAPSCCPFFYRCRSMPSRCRSRPRSRTLIHALCLWTRSWRMPSAPTMGRPFWISWPSTMRALSARCRAMRGRA